VTDESLFREVDEEVRQDQAKAIWTRYGNLISAVGIGIVLAVAALKGWQYMQVKQSEAAGKVFFEAAKLDADGKTEDAVAAFKAVNHAGYGLLAKVREAAALAKGGKRDDAVKLYDTIAADQTADAAIRDLARVRAGYLLADTLKPDELLTRLGALDVETGPWRHAAREIFGLSAWRTADYSMADRYFNAIIADPESSSAARQRATRMVQLLTPLLTQK
jgi:hypothetical protein